MLEKLKEKILSGELSFYTCVICVGLLSLKIHWLPPFMILLVVLRFLERKSDFLSVDRDSLKAKYLFFMFLILFLWQMSGLILAESLLPGLERMVKRTAFVFFPAALFFPSQEIREKMPLIMRIFVFCIIAYLIYCFANAINHSFIRVDGKLVFHPYHPENTWETWFTGPQLSGKVHPSYLAMYVLLSAMLCINFFFEGSREDKKRFIWLPVSLLLLLSVILLASRSGVISIAIIVPLFMFLKLKSKIPLGFIVGFSILFIVIIFLLAKANTRLKYTIEDFSGKNIERTLASDIRMNIWRSATGIIKDHLIIGIGTGNASRELKKEFLRRGYTEGYYETLNAHNQFIEILLENGIVGILCFLVLMVYLGYISISDQNYLLLVYLLMTVIFFISESMLNRLAGVTFFSLFTFLLIHYRPKSPEKLSE